MNDAFGLPQSVVVLGGTSDIALAITELLISKRARHVVLAGRDPGRLADAVTRIEGAGADGVGMVEFDATVPGDADRVVAEAFGAMDQVDLVLVAVGLLGDQLKDERDPDAAAEIVTVNATWPTAALAAAVRRMEEQGSGRIVVLSSVAGVRVRRANFLYGAAKSALDGAAVGFGEACRGTGVTVQVVRPGFVHSKMTAGMEAAPFSTTPEGVARAVVAGLATGVPVIWVPPVLRLAFAVLRQLPTSVWRRLPG